METNRHCVACGLEFGENDDVVCCPVCGAPHHRECYKKTNECALHSLHGTEEQYAVKRVQVKKDREENEPKGKKGVIPSSLLGGYNEKDDIGGVTAGDAGRFVSFNSAKYVSLFAKMGLAGKKASFNLLAFFFPEIWFFLRKNYLAGVLVSVIMAAAEIMCYPVISLLPEVESTAEMYRELMALIPTLPKAIFVLLAAAGVINLGIRLFSGIFGDYVYKKRVFSAIKEFRRENPKSEGNELLAIGGINPFATLIGFAITSILPNIIISFI